MNNTNDNHFTVILPLKPHDIVIYDDHNIGLISQRLIVIIPVIFSVLLLFLVPSLSFHAGSHAPRCGGRLGDGQQRAGPGPAPARPGAGQWREKYLRSFIIKAAVLVIPHCRNTLL